MTTLKNKLKNYIYKFSVKSIMKRMVLDQNLLKPIHLKEMGWVKEGTSWIEPNVKYRDKIWIDFENHYFRVYHGKNKTFIALESKLEWFEMYYLLMHGDNGRYDLAGI